jgi:predicted N-acetyltransferase YhbS
VDEEDIGAQPHEVEVVHRSIVQGRPASIIGLFDWRQRSEVMGDKAIGVTIRPMRPEDIDDAERVMNLAFGTFFGVPDPLATFGDARMIRTRFTASPDAAFVAELDGRVVGSNLATRWGSFGFFGPLTVDPELWDRGIARRLMVPVVDLFDAWNVRQAALYTFAHSPKHIGLYQRFGFWPHFLTAMMARPVTDASADGAVSLFSRVSDTDRQDVLDACSRVTDAVFGGLDLGREITTMAEQNVGDTVLLYEDADLSGIGICYCGAGETGRETCYVKFAAVRPGPDAALSFARLLDACTVLAAQGGLTQMEAGMNLGRHVAYKVMLERGYRTGYLGVRMVRPDGPDYCSPDDFVIDDLR